MQLRNDEAIFRRNEKRYQKEEVSVGQGLWFSTLISRLNFHYIATAFCVDVASVSIKTVSIATLNEIRGRLWSVKLRDERMFALRVRFLGLLLMTAPKRRRRNDERLRQDQRRKF